jgi:predicted transcriptional regulator of viral defense system
VRESYRKAVSIIHQHNGLLRSRQAQQLGIDPKTISEMHQGGILDRIGRGLYRLTDLPPLDYPDLVQIALRVPSAVICLITALAFHNLTVEVPK